MTAALRPGLAGGEARWAGDLPFNFVGGRNDPGSVPFGGLAQAATVALARHGTALAHYHLGGSPQGPPPLREFAADALGRRAPRCRARRMRLCFGHLDVDSIDRGIAALAGVVRHNGDLGD